MPLGLLHPNKAIGSAWAHTLCEERLQQSLKMWLRGVHEVRSVIWVSGDGAH